MTRAAAARLPAVEPIAPMTELLDASWLGRRGEAAGYGETETGPFGTRGFVVHIHDDTGYECE